MSKRLPSFDDCISLERFTGGDFYEKKNLLCYSSDKMQGICLKDLTAGTEQTITAGGRGEGNPAFSPDGKQILFLSSGPGGRQIFLFDRAAGDVRQLTKIAGAAQDPLWSPDGRHILFSAVAGASAPKQTRPDEPIVIEEFGYKFDGLGYIRPEGHMHLYVADTDSGEASEITDGQCDYLHAAWSPDGRSIVCVSDRYSKDKGGLDYSLVLIENIFDREGRCALPKIRKISEERKIVSYPNPMRPVFFPDGKSVACGVLQENDPDLDENDYPDVFLCRFYLDEKKDECLFEKDDECYQCVQFPYNSGCGWGLDKLEISEDGQRLYFLAGWQGQACLYVLDLQKGKHAGKLASGKVVFNGIGRVQNGKMLAAFSRADQPEQYVILECTTGKILQQAAQSSQELLEEVQLNKPEDFFFRTLDGADEVHCFVQPPAVREEGKKYPLILYVHGGPHPFYTYGLTMEFQALAAQGFAVLYCNPRGSSGYGRAHQTYRQAVDGTAYTDLLQAVDEAARRFDWIDGDRAGVTGGSYGGYMTNYMATHSKRFKAYITQRCVSNEMIEYACSDLHGDSSHFSRFEDFMLDAIERSAVAYAERIDRPLLILHGVDDLRTPVENAHQLFVAVKDTHPDLPVRMVLFPHTAHEQPTDPELLEIYYREMCEWFTRYL